MKLLETINPAGKRHYQNGVRITEHEFCRLLLAARGKESHHGASAQGLKPDSIETIGRQTRHYWNI